jgi:hypothetical protein
MNIQNEPFSDLLNKHTLITIELSRLSALMVYYSDSGNKAKLAQTIDAIKRLEMNKSAIAIELDKRIENGPSKDDIARYTSGRDED